MSFSVSERIGQLVASPSLVRRASINLVSDSISDSPVFRRSHAAQLDRAPRGRLRSEVKRCESLHNAVSRRRRAGFTSSDYESSVRRAPGCSKTRCARPHALISRGGTHAPRPGATGSTAG